MIFRTTADDSLSVYANGVLLNTFRYSSPLVNMQTFNFLSNENASVVLTTGRSNATIYYPPYIRMFAVSSVPSVTRVISLTQMEPVYSIDFSDNSSLLWNISVPSEYTLDVHVALDEQYSSDLEKFELYDGTQDVGK